MSFILLFVEYLCFVLTNWVRSGTHTFSTQVMRRKYTNIYPAKDYYRLIILYLLPGNTSIIPFNSNPNITAAILEGVKVHSAIISSI